MLVSVPDTSVSDVRRVLKTTTGSGDDSDEALTGLGLGNWHVYLYVCWCGYLMNKMIVLQVVSACQPFLTLFFGQPGICITGLPEPPLKDIMTY